MLPCAMHKNTPEIRCKLLNLGYTLCGCFRTSDDPQWICCTPTDALFHLTNNPKEVLHAWAGRPVWCSDNEKLFLAVAAIRNDSDMYQWFTDGEYWVVCATDKWGCPPIEACMENEVIDISPNGFHKATVEELINHFKERDEI